jgi:hypothetical protein
MNAIERKIKFLEDKLTEKERSILYLNNLQDILSYGKLVEKGEHIKYKTFVKNEIKYWIYYAFAP